MSAQNIQVNNVGNLGDIIKHVALVQLGSHVVDYARETQSQIFYIDTHTFIVESLIAKAQQWYDNINSMSSTNPESYEKYKSLQKKRLDSGKPYRCSSGIAIDLFAKEKAKFIFSEQDSKTREILKNQLSQEPLSSTDYTIMTHSTQLSSLKDLDLLKCNQSVLFALVDPFELTQEEWQAIMNGIESIQETANVKEGVIEVHLCFLFIFYFFRLLIIVRVEVKM